MRFNFFKNKSEDFLYYVLYLFGVFSLTLTIMCVKKVHKSFDLPYMQVICIREAFIVIAMIPFMIRDRFNFLKAKPMTLHLKRHGLFSLSTAFWYFGLCNLPVNEVITYSFLTPVLAIVLAKFVAKEETEGKIFLSIFLGFLGCIMMQFDKINFSNFGSVFGTKISTFAYISTIVAILIRAYLPLLNKELSTKAKVSESNYMSHIIFFAFCLLFLQTFKPIPLQSIPLILLSSVAFVIEYLAISIVYKRLQIYKIQPLDFSKIIFSTILSYFILGEKVTTLQVVGFSVIILSYFMSKKKINKK